MVEGDGQVYVGAEGHRVQSQRPGRQQRGRNLRGAAGGPGHRHLSGLPGVYLEIPEKRAGGQGKTLTFHEILACMMHDILIKIL